MEHPVYPLHYADFDGTTEPIGTAATEQEALALMIAFNDGTGWDETPKPVLHDRDWKGGQIWAWWDVSEIIPG